MRNANEAADLIGKHERQDRVGIYCAVCGKEETFYNLKVEREDRTEAFTSEIYCGEEIDYLLYFCSSACIGNKPEVADDRVPEDRKYLFADLREKPDPIVNL
jgi:hypothetical protein